MRLAQEHDAVEHGVAYVSAHRRRLFAPDTRSRVIGYLATAPVATPGYRTDGEWVWPDTLADRVRQSGAAPQEQFYEHMRQRCFLLPAALTSAALDAAAAAAAGPRTRDPAPPWDWIHLGGYADQTGPAEVLLRIRLREDGSVAESRYGPTGWDASHVLRSQQSRPRLDHRQYVEISGREAAALNDRFCQEAHDAVLARARETDPSPESLRLARVFDGESPTGVPWFSPKRLRIPERLRRERIAAYLEGGRLVVRAAERLADPLNPRFAVGQSYRTDGRWIWQESLAHYVRTRGVAPELEFLCHIEERGYVLPASLPADVVPRAGVAVKRGPAPRVPRPPLTYFWQPSGGLLRSWGREPADMESLRDDLRWGRPRSDRPSGLPAPAYREISEAEAVGFVDGRWAAGEAVPPLD